MVEFDMRNGSAPSSSTSFDFPTPDSPRMIIKKESFLIVERSSLSLGGIYSCRQHEKVLHWYKSVLTSARSYDGEVAASIFA
jgi:hypothetical protein